MKKWASIIMAMVLFSSVAMAQQEETRRHSSGPRRQLATIVFAGLGGAILGLSTLSFYGRPQDQLSNIAIGFAVGIIGGTVYVTFRSATTRDYYDDHGQPTTLNPYHLESPDSVISDDSLVTRAIDSKADSSDEPPFVYGPLLTRVTPDHNAYGGVVAFHF